MKVCAEEGCEREVVARGLCGTHYMRVRRAKNPDLVKADNDKRREYRKAREARIKAEDPEKFYADQRKRNKKYRETHPDRVSERNKRNYSAEYQRDYYAKNPEPHRNRQHRRRVAKRSGDSRLVSMKDLRRLYASPCAICGATEDIHADHIIPLVRGGRHSIGNLQPLCADCNLRKGTLLMIEYRARLLRKAMMRGVG